MTAPIAVLQPQEETQIITNFDTEAKAATALQKATALVIATPADLEFAESEIELLKALEDEINGTYGPRITQAHKLHKDLLADQNKALIPVNDARKEYKQKCIQYRDEQERLRREEEARLREQARREAEEENLRMAAQAEADGDAELAEAIISAPVETPRTKLPPSVPPPSRLSAARETWSCECFDPPAVLRAALSGNQNALAVFASDAGKEFIGKALGSIARMQKQAFNLPGCRAVMTRG